MNLKEPNSMNTVLRKVCTLCFSFHPSLPLCLFPSFPQPLSCACETLLRLTNKCCVWASTSVLPQTRRWLCQIQHDRLNTTFSFLPFFFCNKSEWNCGYHSHIQKKKFTGKVLLSCGSWIWKHRVLFKKLGHFFFYQ